MYKLYQAACAISLCAIAVLALFFVLSFAAMTVYPGGTNVDPSTQGYSFTHNFFSDLGRTHSFSGTPQRLPHILFTGALSSMGVMTVLYFIFIQFLFSDNRRSFGWAIAGSMAGIFAGICYVEVALTPWDLYFSTHMTFVRAAFLFMLVAVAFYTAAFYFSTVFSRRYAVVLGLFSLLAAAYLTLLLFGPDMKTPAGLIIQVGGQKIIVFLEAAVMGYMAWGTAVRAKKILREKK